MRVSATCPMLGGVGASTSNSKQQERLKAPADRIEAIQARMLPAEALDIVPDEEALQYAGGYLK